MENKKHIAIYHDDGTINITDEDMKDPCNYTFKLTNVEDIEYVKKTYKKEDAVVTHLSSYDVYCITAKDLLRIVPRNRRIIDGVFGSRYYNKVEIPA